MTFHHSIPHSCSHTEDLIVSYFYKPTKKCKSIQSTVVIADNESEKVELPVFSDECHVKVLLSLIEELNWLLQHELIPTRQEATEKVQAAVNRMYVQDVRQVFVCMAMCSAVGKTLSRQNQETIPQTNSRSTYRTTNSTCFTFKTKRTISKLTFEELQLNHRYLLVVVVVVVVVVVGLVKFIHSIALSQSWTVKSST